MIILQISDLHLGYDGDEFKTLYKKTDLLVKKIVSMITKNETIICCILGDIVDVGKKEFYKSAKELLLKLRENITKHVDDNMFKFLLVPGNHDLCADNPDECLKDFNSFASDIMDYEVTYRENQSVVCIDYGGYRFININTALHGNYKYGNIDYDQISRAQLSSKNIVLAHHALINSDENDSAAIRSGYILQEYLEKNKIIAFLHGHTHGCKRYTVGDDCQVIGVGPLFKNEKDISNQCNIIEINGDYVDNIQTLTYHADRECWDSIQTYKKEHDNNYYGTSVQTVYNRLVDNANKYGPISNLRIQIDCSYVDFERDIESVFSIETMKEASEWQAPTPPESLEYTHRELMNNGSTSWEDFAIPLLIKNPTNKRTIIPLIEKEKVINAEDGKLVSFDVVQFGMENSQKTKLIVTVYFRALEIIHFLPINFCEVLLMIKKILRFP